MMGPKNLEEIWVGLTLPLPQTIFQSFKNLICLFTFIQILESIEDIEHFLVTWNQ